MNRQRFPFPALVLVVLGAMAVAACGGTKRKPVVVSSPGGGPGTGTGVDRTQAQPVDEGPDVIQPLDEQAPTGTDFGTDFGAGEGGPLADVHFDFDQAALSEHARSTLEKHALWLQTNRDLRVTIEGHCDERGTVEYNLALGESRARAAREYLLSLGVAPERLTTVSYGKEKPMDAGHTEQAWASNRRAHFAVSR